MGAEAMDVHGAALWAFFEGETGAEEILRTDSGRESSVPVRHFFNRGPEFVALENAALARCAGRVLDAGAGTGLHAMVLQETGLEVTALDISPRAVEIMRRRGVRDVHCADILTYQGGPFDTLLMLGHGLGMTGTLAGLDRFLAHALDLVSPGGQILADSLDVRVTTDPDNLDGTSVRSGFKSNTQGAPDPTSDGCTWTRRRWRITPRHTDGTAK